MDYLTLGKIILAAPWLIGFSVHDFRLQTTLSDCTRQGEWTVPVTFSDSALVNMPNSVAETRRRCFIIASLTDDLYRGLRAVPPG